MRTTPACFSPSTVSPNLQSLGPDCDSGAQFVPQDPEMASVKLEDCSQTLELNVNIKDEEEEEKIGKSVSHGKTRFYLNLLFLSTSHCAWKVVVEVFHDERFQWEGRYYFMLLRLAYQHCQHVFNSLGYPEWSESRIKKWSRHAASILKFYKISI